MWHGPLYIYLSYAVIYYILVSVVLSNVHVLLCTIRSNVVSTCLYAQLYKCGKINIHTHHKVSRTGNKKYNDCNIEDYIVMIET